MSKTAAFLVLKFSMSFVSIVPEDFKDAFVGLFVSVPTTKAKFAATSFSAQLNFPFFDLTEIFWVGVFVPKPFFSSGSSVGTERKLPRALQIETLLSPEASAFMAVSLSVPLSLSVVLPLTYF